MIEKNEENTDNDSHLVRIRLITDKRTFLEKQFLQVIFSIYILRSIYIIYNYFKVITFKLFLFKSITIITITIIMIK